MDGLGRVANVAWTAASTPKWISVKDCSAVMVIGSGADTFTVTEAKDASGTGAKSPVQNTITRWYGTAVGAGSAWTETVLSGSGANAVVSASAVTVFTIDCKGIDPLFSYVKVAATSTAVVVVVPIDLDVQRAPQNLPALGV